MTQVESLDRDMIWNDAIACETLNYVVHSSEFSGLLNTQKSLNLTALQSRLQLLLTVFHTVISAAVAVRLFLPYAFHLSRRSRRAVTWCRVIREFQPILGVI